MENWCWCNSIVTPHHYKVFFMPWQHSTAVMPWDEFYSDHFNITWMRLEWNFHRIWIIMEKIVNEMDPYLQKKPGHHWPCINLVLMVYHIFSIRGPFYWHDFTLSAAWISNYIIIICGMKLLILCVIRLLIHSQTSMVQLLKFDNG